MAATRAEYIKMENASRIRPLSEKPVPTACDQFSQQVTRHMSVAKRKNRTVALSISYLCHKTDRNVQVDD